MELKKEKVIVIFSIIIAVIMLFNMCSSGISFSNTDQGFRIKAKCSYSSGKCTINGSIKNNNSSNYHTVQLRVLVYDDDENIIGSEGVFINDINEGESRDFQEFIDVDEKPGKMDIEIFGLL